MTKKLNIFLLLAFFGFFLVIVFEVILKNKFGYFNDKMVLTYYLCVIGLFILFPFSIGSFMLSVGASLFVKDSVISKRILKSPIYFLLWWEIRSQLRPEVYEDGKSDR